ncbi:uncharacterized protein [Procambarus clarkii]|uniref:uncharacterized protein isoform X2 n=1 Tax=Procambarus clarkii TaxID=6728 RepID=UPI001E6783D2|nr:mucin-5AC-like isoform X2 [Procambarus clarkii]
MRLYTPAKSASPEEEGGEGVLDASLNNQNNYDSRAVDLTRRAIEKDSRFDDKLHLNSPRGDDKTQLHLTRLDDTLHFNGPLREERHLGTQINGIPTTQNGARTLDFSPSPLENGTDTITSLESVPWNIEGTDTIKENGCKSLLSKWSLTSEENGQDTAELSEEAELKQLREENKKLKAALKEAAEVNGQWRNYHDQRQKYVQRLLTTIQELHHPHQSAHSAIQVEGETGPEAEVRRLRAAFTKLQADHDEHVTLLEMQVRAHRDDWEAERSEKQATQTALAEAQARTALLLHELQLLQAKLADSESKRSLCWRCMLPQGGEASGGGGRAATTTTTTAPSPPPPTTTTSTTSHSAQPSPVPAPSAPSPAPPPPPTTHHVPQTPLKGWIPVSMLHHIAFSGATPEHQSPVVQGQQRSQQQQQQQPSRAPLHHHHHHQQQQQTGSTVLRPRPTSLSTSNNVRREMEQTAGAEPSTSSNTESKALSPRVTHAHDTKNLLVGTTDDKKKYEAMGARPKVLGNLQTGVGKGLGLLEDEKTAKHRARSILASAIPVSPVSSGPSTPLGTCIKTPSIPSMPKGYMPITSTVLTPINFRPPFVAHKRPSTMKQVAQAAQVSATPSSSSTSAKGHNGSSPGSLCGDTTTTSSGCHSTPSITKNTTVSNTTNTAPVTVSEETHNKIISSQINDRIKSPDAASQENKVTTESVRKHETQSSTGVTGRRRTDDPTSNSVRSQSSDGVVTRMSCSSPTTTFTCTSPSNITSLSCSNVTNATTTVCCSSPTTHTTSSSSSLPSISAAGVNTEAVSGAPGHTSVKGIQPSSAMTAFQSSSPSTGETPKSNSNTVSSHTAAGDTVSQSHNVSAHDTTRNTNNGTISIISPNSCSTTLPSQTTTTDTTATKSSNTTNNSTAFASITVTTTATGTNVPPTASTYSSATSSRSSSPGISLTTFGLNSEGRGIPGAIFFALGSDQRGGRSPQPCTSPRRTSNASVGVKSPTPDAVTSGQPQRDTLPPSGVKSPTIVLNSSSGPATVKEEHWWSVESPDRQGSQGKVVNSTWVRLMGGQANSRQDSGLPWRTARAVSGQQLKKARRISQDDANGPISPNSVSSSTATFTYTPAVNSPPSSTLSSATNSAASSPPPSFNPRSNDDLKSMASKNIASAIISYELGSKCESPGSGSGAPVGSGSSPDGVATLTRRQLVCPSCQMLFPPDKHINFLDHFETCHGPEYADL